MLSGCCGGVSTSAEKSPLRSLMFLPAFAISGICPMRAKSRRSPTAVSTEPSMMPTGGTKNPATMSMRLAMKLRWKSVMCCECYGVGLKYRGRGRVSAPFLCRAGKRFSGSDCRRWQGDDVLVVHVLVEHLRDV